MWWPRHAPPPVGFPPRPPPGGRPDMHSFGQPPPGPAGLFSFGGPPPPPVGARPELAGPLAVGGRELMRQPPPTPPAGVAAVFSGAKMGDGVVDTGVQTPRGGSAHWSDSDPSAGRSTGGGTDTEPWLAAWAERTGVAQRSAEPSKKKNAMKLSGLRRLSESERAEPGTAALLRRLVRLRRRRRLAQRRRRRAERQRLLRLHRQIDARQAALRQQEARQKEAEEVKREADKVLGEVRRKISDVEKHLETLDELRTLREVRDLKARSSGLFSSAESDQRFAEVTGRLTELLDRHLVTYEAELRTLAAMTAAPAAGPAPAPAPAAAAARRALRALFGADGVSSEAAAAAVRLWTDGARPGLTTQAGHALHMLDWEKHPQTLLQIRADWDQYLVSEEDPLGSAVPPSWVVPAPPSSDVWASWLIS